MSTDRRSLLAALLPAVLVGCASAPTAESSAADAGPAIERAWNEHIEAAQRKDLPAVMQIYAEDIVYAFEGQPDLRGRAALEISESAALAGADVLEAVHTTLALQAFDEYAFELGSIVGPVQPHGGEASVVRYHYMAYWQRGPDGVWRIRRLAGRT